MQTARISVIAVVELSARVQLSKNHLHAADLLRRMNVYGNTAAVVFHRRRTVRIELDFYGVAVTVGYFVHTVIDYFPQNVMQSLYPGRADIHTRAQTHCVQPLEYADIFGFIFFGF